MAALGQQQLQPQSQPESLMRLLRENALVSFAQQTTAHGLMRLTQGSGLRRLIWGLAVVGACAGFSVHLVELAQRYLSYPVSTEFSSEGADFQFPTVTICPTNFITYHSPAIVSNFSISGHPRKLSDMIYDIPRMYHLLQQADWNVSMPGRAYSSYQDGKLALRALAYRQMLFQQPYETVIYCRYNSQLCSFQNFTLYKDENRFLCMSFKPANRTLVRPGEGNGLYLVLYDYGKAFLTEEEQIDNVPGFRVALHEDGFKPDMDSGFTVPFGYKTSAQMSIQTDTKVNREAAPCSDVLPNATYTVDFSRPENVENQSFFGSTQDCIMQLMQEEFRNACGCLGTHLALPSDLLSDTGVCHALPEELFFFDIYHRLNAYKLREYTITNKTWAKLSLASYLLSNWQVYNATATMMACYHRVRYRQETQGVLVRQCPVRCSNTRYAVATSLAAWPRESSKASSALRGYTKDIRTAIAASNLSDYRLSFLYKHSSHMITNKYISVLDLYPRSTRVTVSTESWAYPLRNFFSDLGGILGLWVGVSVITLLELVELVVQLGYLSALRLQSASAQVHLQPAAETDVLENAPRDIYASEEAKNERDSIDKPPELQLDVSLPPKPQWIPPNVSGGVRGSSEQYNPSWFQRMFSI